MERGKKFRIALIVTIGIFILIINFYQFVRIPFDEDAVIFLFAYAGLLLPLLVLSIIYEYIFRKFSHLWILIKLLLIVETILWLAFSISSLYFAYGGLKFANSDYFIGGLFIAVLCGALAYVGFFYGALKSIKNLFSFSSKNILENLEADSGEQISMENLTSANKYPPTSIPTIVSIVMLLMGIPEIFPYGYYSLLRIVVCGTSGYIAYVAFEMEKRIIGFLSIFVVIIFNPLFVVHLDKGLWVIIDLIVAIFFGTTIFLLKTKTFYAEQHKPTKRKSPKNGFLSEDMEWCQVGYEYILEKKYDLAKECMEESLKINPENVFALLNMGTIYTFEGRNDKAIELYEKVIALNSDEVAKSCTEKGEKGSKVTDIALKNHEELKRQIRIKASFEDEPEIQNGDSIDNAIFIDAPNTIIGIIIEFQHIEKMFGQRDKDWVLIEQSLIGTDQKKFDKIIIKTNDGSKKEIYFDITSFFGKH